MSVLDDDLVEALEGSEVTAEHISRRVDDWLERLRNLFDGMKEWATANGWSVEDGEPMPMREEMMLRFGLPEREQPTLFLRDPHGQQVWIKPKALWVIGANGRVDIYGPSHVFVLVDLALALSPPQWVLHRLGAGNGRAFTPDLIADMV